MKIIISPSKTQDLSKSDYLLDKEILYIKEHKKILAQLRKLSKTDIKRIMKIDNNLLNLTYNNIKNYNKLPTYNAFESFNGLVFKGLQKELYHENEYDYIQQKLIIIDAFYGILEPGTLIKPYRLDMKMNIGLNLYSIWKIDNYFKNEMVINLASNEFSKLINTSNLVNISFLQAKNGKFVNQATYSKQERGRFLNYLIINSIDSVSQMKEYKDNNYGYNKELSNINNIVFTRTN
jgi:cytoplasmic iron level regulating protein YaaA (DUF328/UPF0246 family)